MALGKDNVYEFTQEELFSGWEELSHLRAMKDSLTLSFMWWLVAGPKRAANHNL